jgi:hypothetical protein
LPGLWNSQPPSPRDFTADSEFCVHGFIRFEFASDSIRARLAIEEVVHLSTGSRRAPEHFNGVLELVAQRFHESVSDTSRMDVNPQESIWSGNLQIEQQAGKRAATSSSNDPHYSVRALNSLDQAPKRLGPLNGLSNRLSNIRIGGSYPRRRRIRYLGIDGFRFDGGQPTRARGKDRDE